MNRLRNNDWRKTKNKSVTADKFDTLGAAIDMLSSFGSDLKIEQMQILLAVGTLSESAGWVKLKNVKAKLPTVSEYQFSRHLKALSGNLSVLGFFSDNAALITIKSSASSKREKEVRLTSFGLLALHRTLQTLEASYCSRESSATNSHGIDFTLQLEGSFSNRDAFAHRVSRLLSTGRAGIGKTITAEMLCRQAIAQGAIVYWIGASSCKETSLAMHSCAEDNHRAHAFFVNGSDSRKTVSASEVFMRDGICFHMVEYGDKDPEALQFTLDKIMKDVASAALNNGSSGAKHTPAHIIIDGLSSLTLLSTPDCRRSLDSLMVCDAKLHIIERGSDPEEYDYYYRHGFEHAILAVEDARLFSGDAKVSGDLKPEDVVRMNSGQIRFRDRSGLISDEIELDHTPLEERRK